VSYPHYELNPGSLLKVESWAFERRSKRSRDLTGWYNFPTFGVGMVVSVNTGLHFIYPTSSLRSIHVNVSGCAVTNDGKKHS